MTNQNKAVIMASFVVFFWATVATAFKLALAGMNAVTLLLISSLTALLIFTLYLAKSGTLYATLKTLKQISRILNFKV